jgi:hypothetical protein
MTPGLAAVLFDGPDAGAPPDVAGEPPAAAGTRDEAASGLRAEDAQDLRRLHAEARASTLPPEDAARYSALVARLLERAVAAQNASLRLRERPRKVVRIRRALQVEVSWGAEVHRVLTLDVGTGGFSALLPLTPPREGTVAVRLQLARGEHLMLIARVADVRERRGTSRVSFAFENLGEAGVQRLERCLVHDLVCQLASRADLR